MTPKNVLILLPVFYFVVILYSVLGVYFFEFGQVVPFGLYNSITYSSFFTAINGYGLALLCFYVGSVILRFHVKSNRKVITYEKTLKKIRIGSPVLLLLLVFYLIVLHLGMGFSHVYFREGYVISNNQSMGAFRVIQVIALPVVVLLLALSRNRKLGLALLVIIYLYVLGLSSRQLLLVPVFYYIGVCYRENGIPVYKFLFLIPVVLVSLLAVTSFRDNIYQGLYPNAINLLLMKFNYEGLVVAFNYIFSYSIISSAYVVENHSVDVLSLIYSVTPLPSSLIDIGYMLENQKINEHAPFPAISILLLSGYHYVALYYFASGFIWCWVLKKSYKRNKYVFFLLSCLFLLFAVLSTQYNLRGVTRLIYYSIVIYVSFASAQIFLRNLKKVYS